MYADILLTLISVQLLIIMLVVLKTANHLMRYNPENMIRRAVLNGIKDLTSKSTLKRVETNTMPYIIKLVVVKVASAVLIRYIGKKILK